MLVDSEYLKLLDKVLTSVLAAGASDAVVAGGAIRDMLLEKEIVDIDVFIKGDISYTKLWSFFSKLETCDNGAYPDSEFNVLFKCWRKDLPVPIQIIKVEKGSIENHIYKFPTPFSRVSYCKDNGLIGIDWNFLHGGETKQLMFDRKVNLQYVDKMVKKFPDFTVLYDKPEYAPYYLPQTTNECVNF